jgi:hypothetical protein
VPGRQPAIARGTGHDRLRQVRAAGRSGGGALLDSPIDWNFKANPDEVAGQVACGSYQGNADIMWTQYDQLLLADVQSTDMNALHDWWLNYS